MTCMLKGLPVQLSDVPLVHAVHARTGPLQSVRARPLDQPLKALVESSSDPQPQLSTLSQQQPGPQGIKKNADDAVFMAVTHQQRFAAFATSVLVVCNALVGVALPDQLMPTAFAKQKLTSDEQLTIEIFKRNTPSVVNVTNLAAK